ncbi:hypothetical protein [Aurantiacibacter sp. D1-12]|uniref:hypothetical protein n=1 Tax=Aurantiacibacter sp. D1-12 TaxID=2993658 RepID=UPI00237CCC97|nr:hypothetical protein [Aurantiacibacter sp. D1-12]MDE1466568.1 hypothetical protein [Aurantiacibacter sp. D1-12]
MRIVAIAVLFALAACTPGEDLAEGTPIECALGGAAGFTEECLMERQTRENQRLLIVRHPDGAFRRFEIGVPEQGLITADGVEQAIVDRSDGFVEVRVGPDRYRLPIAE